MGSINYKEKVAILNYDESGYTNIEYGTKIGLKRGFVPNGNIKSVNNISLPSIPTNANVTKGVYGYSGKGRELAYYKIGNGSKALVAVFAIHGFEDAWASDGVELCKMASDTIRVLSNMGDLNGWAAYIIPTANPDGVIEGFTNDGPGRCTVADQTDLNRSFPSNPISFPTGSRNYNGGRPLVATEAINLNNFIHKTKKEHSSMVLLDIHGWEDKTIGNGEIGAYFGEQFGFGNIEKYPQGFLITEGNAIGAKSTLVELPMPSSSNDIKNRGFSQKVSTAIQNIIKRNAGTSTNAVDSTKVTPVDAKQGKVVNITSHLNIRNGAGTNYDIVGTLQPNQVVDLYGQVDNWYKIYLGYVSKDFIEKLKDTPTQASNPKAEIAINKKGQVVNVTSHLNIRSGAGTNFDVVETLQPNQIVDVYSENGEWYKLYLGYVNKNYIKIINNASPSPKPTITTSVNKKGKVNLNVLCIRDKASFKSNIIGELKNNTVIDVLKELNGYDKWYEVKAGSVNGFVLGKYLVILNEFKNKWKTSENKKYYIRDGKAVTGWQLIEGNKYYFNDDGSMVTGRKVIDDELCNFKETGEFFKEKLRNEEPRVTKEEVIDYMKETIDQVIYGRYTDSVTGLGTVTDITIAFFGLDLPQNIRDITYDVQHLKDGWENVGNLALDTISVLPVVGIIKYGKEAKILVKTEKGECKVATTLSKGGKILSVATLEKLNKELESIYSSIKNVSNGFLDSIQDVIIEVDNKYLFNPKLSYAGADISDVCYISKSEIKDLNKFESAAKKEGRIVKAKVLTIAEKTSEYYNKVIKETTVIKKYSKDTAPSKILKSELLRAGVSRPPYSFQAHHIVAINDKNAKSARDILEKYKIELNSASNGVFLPGVTEQVAKNHPYISTEARHLGSHTLEYFNTINKRISKVEEVINQQNYTYDIAKDFICRELHSIRKDLLEGNLKIHKN